MKVEYSIDMVRLKTDLPIKTYKKGDIFKPGFDELIDKPLRSEPKVKYQQKFSITDYRHNFYIEDYNLFGDKCSFYLACGHNSKNSSVDVDVIIDYNPNKCSGSPILEYLIDNIFKSPLTMVQSLDVACDIPCNILDLKPVISGNRCFTTKNYGGDNKTYYFGSRSHNGHIKIYNKKRESGLDYELTRYELTIVPKALLIYMLEDFTIDSSLFIDIRSISSFQMPIDINDTDRVLLLACMDNPDYLKMLGRVKRKKIEQLLADNCSISFDCTLIDSTIKEFLKTIYSL